MTDVEIVPIRLEHVESFHRSLDIVARERDYLAMTEAPPIEATRAFVTRNIEQRFPQFVAHRDGNVVGWCDVLPKERPLYAHGGVLGMALLPAFRGRGLGQKLMVTTLEATRESGLERVELTVRADNLRAIKLYQRVGFAPEGVMRRAVHIDGVHKDVCLMAIAELGTWAIPKP